MSLYADIAWGRTTKLNQEELNRRAKIIADAIEALRAFAPSWEAEVEALRSVGLDRINNALLPAYQQIIEIANLGALLSTTSDSSVTIGNGTKTFVVPETKRLNFAPTPYLIAYANGDFDLAMIGTVSSYSSETGELVIAVQSFTGAGAFASWNIGPVATTADLEALRDEVEADKAAAQASEANAAASASAAASSASDSAASATAAASSATAAAATLTTFQAAWYGAQATEPAGAAVGSQYLDISQTPNLVKVLTETGWSPTVTISIGGSRQQVYTATEGQVGPFTVDGGFSNGSVNVNGVELIHGNGVTLDAGAGTFTLDQARSAGDVILFRGYLANDAADIFTKSEADQRFVSGKHTQTFTPAEKGRARGNLGADLLGGYRNKLINGDFDFWQRGTTFGPTGSTLYTADRWVFNNSGGTAAISRQDFAPGQTDVPGNPKYFLRLAVTTGNDFTSVMQRLEGVHTLAGRQATVTFWAKGTNPGGGKAYVYGLQLFGSGGSPNLDVPGREIVLTSNWQKFTHVFDIPSIAGKTVAGTGHYFALIFGQYDDASTAAWTMDIAHVSLVEGDATGENDPFSPRHLQQELALCQRYFWKSFPLHIAPGTPSSVDIGTENSGFEAFSSTGLRDELLISWRFPHQMRASPSVVIYSPKTGAAGQYAHIGGSNEDMPASLVGSPTASGARTRPDASPGAQYRVFAHITADAEI